MWATKRTVIIIFIITRIICCPIAQLEMPMIPIETLHRTYSPIPVPRSVGATGAGAAAFAPADNTEYSTNSFHPQHYRGHGEIKINHSTLIITKYWRLNTIEIDRPGGQQSQQPASRHRQWVAACTFGWAFVSTIGRRLIICWDAVNTLLTAWLAH